MAKICKFSLSRSGQECDLKCFGNKALVLDDSYLIEAKKNPNLPPQTFGSPFCLKNSAGKFQGETTYCFEEFLKNINALAKQKQ